MVQSVDLSHAALHREPYGPTFGTDDVHSVRPLDSGQGLQRLQRGGHGVGRGLRAAYCRCRGWSQTLNHHIPQSLG